MRYAWCGRLVTAVLFLGLTAAARADGLFEIHLDAGPGLTANPDALAAFQRAIDDWQSHITSDVPVRINISADLGSFSDPRIIGSTNIFTPATATDDINRPYDTVRDLMAARSIRPGDQILASLPTSAQVQAHVPYGTFDNTTVGITRANQKALGIVNSATDTLADGQITFNSAFTFAYKRSDLNQSNVDFQTAATHEIGHVLGFLSDVDDYDTNTAATLTSDNLTTLDLFRFNTSERPTNAADFTTTARELRPGQPSVTSDTVNSYLMATGVNNGDGSQASHWEDDGQDSNGNFANFPTIGIMDPTLPNGVFENISAADLRAFELIGYDTVVPEPASLALAGLAAISLLSRHRPRRPTAPAPVAT